MSAHNDLRKKRTQLKLKLHSILLTEGQPLRDVKLEERQAKQKFLKEWTRYTKNNQNLNEFLYNAIKLGEIIKKENIEHQKLEKKYLPCVKELIKVKKKLEK